MKRAADTDLDLRRSVARMAPYRPFGKTGQMQVEYAHREYILAAAQENGGKLASLGECQEICKTLWGLALELHDIRAVVSRLVGVGQLVKKGGAYELGPAAQKEMSARIRESSTTEATAFSEWEAALLALDPSLMPEQVGELREDLLMWLHEIVSRHGIEAASLLYPEHERTSELARQISSRGLGFLPQRDEAVTAIRADALYAFIRQPTPAQRTYLAHLMTTAYQVAIFTIDPEAHQVVQTITKGQRIYLDTNVVYRLLNLRGPRDHMAVKRVLEMTRQLGYEVCVTPWTVAEMQESVRRARKKLSQTTLPPRALAELAAEAAGDEAFVTANWRRYKATGVKPDDFLDLHEQIEPMLKKLGVTVKDEGCLAVDRNEEAIREQISLLETIPGAIDKHDALKEHDVKHRLLVERLRGSGNRGFSNAGSFFLTCHSVLMPYAGARRIPNAPPFAVSLMAWAHIVRSLCPRTADYEQTVVDLLDTASVRSGRLVSYQTIVDVLARIDMLVDDSTTEIATRVLLDSAMMGKAESKSGQARTQFIDEVVTEKKAELENQLRELQDAIATERSARLGAEQAAEATASALAEERRARSEAEARAAAAEREREVASAAAEDQAVAARREAEAEKHRRDAEEAKQRKAVADLQEQMDRQTKIARGVIAGLLALVAIAAVAVPVAIGWITGGWPLIFDLVALGVVLAFAVWVAFDKKKAAAVVAVALGVLAGITGLQQIIGTDNAAPSKAPVQR